MRAGASAAKSPRFRLRELARCMPGGGGSAELELRTAGGAVAAATAVMGGEVALLYMPPCMRQFMHTRCHEIGLQHYNNPKSIVSY